MKRILTAAVLIAAVVGILFIGGWAPSILVVLFTGAAMYEMYRALANKEVRPIEYVGYAYAALMAPAYHWLGTSGLLILLVLGCLVSVGHATFSPAHDIRDAIASVFVLVYPGLAMSCLYMMTRLQPYETAVTAVAASVLLAVATDTGAYFTGVLIGKHKLAPEISPKKTVEGAIGGYVLCVAAGVALWLVTERLLPGFDGKLFLWSALGCGVAAQIGDLMASAIKRWCGVKDYGKIFPGHGGVLDRLDSIIAVSAVIYIVFRIGGVVV